MTPWIWPGASVTRVVDGDTFVARLTRDLGFHGTVTFEQRLRLNRINAPAAKTPAGKAALAALERLFGSSPDFTISTVGAYKYGDEWMAEVLDVMGRNVSDEMVSAGAAVYWDGRGPRPADA